jgi:hypothetical protein
MTHENDRKYTDEKELERQAREHVEELKGFYIHLGVFVAVNAFLVILNLLTSPGTFWAIWPLLGWGLAGLPGHAIAVFGLFGLGGKKWEERKVREMMAWQRESLGSDDVRRLLREELGEGESMAKWAERVNRRLENLEAIVTSQDWDAFDTSDLAKPASDSKTLDVEPEADSHEELVNRLSRRVR